MPMGKGTYGSKVGRPAKRGGGMKGGGMKGRAAMIQKSKQKLSPSTTGGKKAGLGFSGRKPKRPSGNDSFTRNPVKKGGLKTAVGSKGGLKTAVGSRLKK